MATDIIARGMITEYIAGTNINFTENRDGTVEISASGSISSEDSVARDAIGNHKSDTSNPHNVTPAQIGLGNVDNTSDLDKPISTAVQQAIDNKADKTVATTSADGLMSAEDKTKLDSVGDTYALKSIYGDTTINVGRKANTTVGDYSTAEGYYTTASGNGSHAEGYYTTASEDCSHAEGYNATASGKWSHAEGNKTTASGNCSHAEGYNTTVSGQFSHAEGRNTTASGMCSHAGGTGTKALHENEVAYGKYNESKDDTVFSVGDGTADDARHNAFEITTTGGKLHDKDIATTDLIPTSLPANGGNADTVDGLHADDFVNATDYSQIQIPNNVDVPVWIHANGKRFQRYMTNGGNTGLTNVPGNSIDYVWYWYDGLNILARDYSSGKYYICDMINGIFSGWKDVYTSGYKPYISGSATVAANNTTCTSNHGFIPSAVIWWDGNDSGVATWFNETQFAIKITSSVDRTINYLIFK